MKKYLEFISEGLEEDPEEYLNELKDLSSDITLETSFEVVVKEDRFPFFNIEVKGPKKFDIYDNVCSDDKDVLKEFMDNYEDCKKLDLVGIDLMKKILSAGWIIKRFHVDRQNYGNPVIQIVAQANINGVDGDMDEVVKVIQPLLDEYNIPFREEDGDGEIAGLAVINTRTDKYWSYSYNGRGQRSTINIFNITEPELYRKIVMKKPHIQKITNRFEKIFKDTYRNPGSKTVRSQNIFIELD